MQVGGGGCLWRVCWRMCTLNLDVSKYDLEEGGVGCEWGHARGWSGGRGRGEGIFLNRSSCMVCQMRSMGHGLFWEPNTQCLIEGKS